MKQMEVVKKKIGGRTFYIKYFPAFVSANISGELSSTIGPLLGGLAPILKVDDIRNLADLDVDQLIGPLVGALSSIQGDKVEHLIKRLIVNYKNVSVKCEETNEDVERLTEDLANEIFCGEIEDMLMLCVEVVRMNFGGFFKKAVTQFGGLTAFTETMTMTDSAR